jgi:hypothetical protein
MNKSWEFIAMKATGSRKNEKKEYSMRTEEQIRVIVFYLGISYAMRRFVFVNAISIALPAR